MSLTRFVDRLLLGTNPTTGTPIFPQFVRAADLPGGMVAHASDVGHVYGALVAPAGVHSSVIIGEDALCVMGGETLRYLDIRGCEQLHKDPLPTELVVLRIDGTRCVIPFPTGHGAFAMVQFLSRAAWAAGKATQG